MKAGFFEVFTAIGLEPESIESATTDAFPLSIASRTHATSGGTEMAGIAIGIEVFNRSN
jgi:hypothetical protein